MEFFCSGYDLWNRGELERWLTLHDPSVVYDFSETQFFDLAPVYRGHDGIRAFWDGAHEPFGRLLIEPLEFTEGKDGIVVRLVMRARGAGSGAPTEARLFHVWRFRGGLIWHLEAHLSEEMARRMAGLGDEPVTGHYPKPDRLKR